MLVYNQNIVKCNCNAKRWMHRHSYPEGKTWFIYL